MIFGKHFLVLVIVIYTSEEIAQANVRFGVIEFPEI